MGSLPFALPLIRPETGRGTGTSNDIGLDVDTLVDRNKNESGGIGFQIFKKLEL